MILGSIPLAGWQHRVVIIEIGTGHSPVIYAEGRTCDPGGRFPHVVVEEEATRSSCEPCRCRRKNPKVWTNVKAPLVYKVVITHGVRFVYL